MKKEKKMYSYRYAKNHNGLDYVCLEDGTEIIFHESALVFRYPKLKMAKIFMRQLFRGDKKLGISFSPVEIEAISDALNKLESE
jgi:hypothetical protein